MNIREELLDIVWEGVFKPSVKSEESKEECLELFEQLMVMAGITWQRVEKDVKAGIACGIPKSQQFNMITGLVETLK